MVEPTHLKHVFVKMASSSPKRSGWKIPKTIWSFTHLDLVSKRPPPTGRTPRLNLPKTPPRSWTEVSVVAESLDLRIGRQIDPHAWHPFWTIFSSWWVVSTRLKNVGQIGSSPQVGVKIKNVWNHHPVLYIYLPGRTLGILVAFFVRLAWKRGF